MARQRDWIRLSTLLLLLLVLGGCGTLGYVVHVARGQAALMRSQRPLAEWLADPATAPQLRRDLEELAAARRFASERLGLPDNGSYSGYAELPRPFVSWVVVAAPEFSVEPLKHCLPFSGCVPYLGYFDPVRAEKARARLAARGFDTYLGGVTAYSTLGWFDDPLLSSMLRAGRDQAIAVVFHELAHQKLYLPGDTAFNESLASFVQREGVRQWRLSRQQAPEDPTRAGREREFALGVLDLQARLSTLYAGVLSSDGKRAAKAAAIADFRRAHRARRAGEWRDFSDFDAWVDGTLNNAALQSFLLYDRWLPAFAALFCDVGGDWSAFHAQVKLLSTLPDRERQARLTVLTPDDRVDSCLARTMAVPRA